MNVFTKERRNIELKEKEEFIEEYVLKHRNLFSDDEDCVNSAEVCYLLIKEKCN